MVRYLRAANVKDGALDLTDVQSMNFTPAEQGSFALRPGDVLVTEGSGSLSSVGASAVWRGELEGTVCFQNTLLRLRPRVGVDGRYLEWWARSAFGSGVFASIASGANIYHLSAERVRALPISLPPLEEQRRIIDFLDAETSQIERLIQLRNRQIELLGQRIAQIVDGIVAGSVESLTEIGESQTAEDWEWKRVSHLCEVIPGYAFPSSGFLIDGSGVKLLRGVNIDTGSLTWGEVVSWDIETSPIHDRFHLRAGDLVLGMDRPWISSGMRISLIQEMDLPALLLQRVACLRPKGLVDMSYVRWVLDSAHFRQSVESEMTGVSVPHLSGEQIGGFTFRVPPKQSQTRISMALADQVEKTGQLQASISRQIELLAERRRALITAAVTDQIDVSTASGRGIEE
ncbi:restriction endonuclease subunit S [Streptomyces sp. ME19-01-6]|uniref:restriction endonuclease subunit S n=1 Tax=Streptomyces sp. ME19-01-6 TaxID=3028686 RepID=UPI0029A4A2AA|nr:restriction endonuclease subunit S [Streptomyces sp. ME19-01-6]MDX3225502.1 restriction endonuclease subunit S [Streptomyces sp. ME19-01-6]